MNERTREGRQYFAGTSKDAHMLHLVGNTWLQSPRLLLNRKVPPTAQLRNLHYA